MESDEKNGLLPLFFHASALIPFLYTPFDVMDGKLTRKMGFCPYFLKSLKQCPSFEII